MRGPGCLSSPCTTRRPRSLSEKLLERPHLLARIAALIPNRARSHLVPYNTTELERDVALCLGIPMYGADPRLAPLGSKTGCRRMFAEAGIPHPLGVENLRTLDDMTDAVVGMRAERASMDSVIVKLNDGVSGEGNALVRLGGLPAPGSSGRAGRRPGAAARHGAGVVDDAARRLPGQVRGGRGHRRGADRRARRSAAPASSSGSCRAAPSSCCRRTTSCSAEQAGRATWAARSRRLRSTPARSPSTPRRSGGGWPTRAPSAASRSTSSWSAGTSGAWTPYAIELNLRKGGTTHPFLTLQFLTDGRYDPTTSLFLTPRGHEKHLVATDHLESGLLRGLALSDLFDIVARHGLHFDQSRQVGIVFHMISCLTEHGRIGLTAVGDTPAEARRRYGEAEAILLGEARLALEERPLPG